MTPGPQSEIDRAHRRGLTRRLLLIALQSTITLSCLPRKRVTVRLIDGHAEATRYVSAGAYEHYLRAKLLLGRGDSGGGLNELKRAISLDDESPYLHCELASALIAVGQIPTAWRHVKRAVALKPDFPYAVALRADLLHGAGRKRVAERAYVRCIALDPSLPRCYLHYAELLDQADRAADARRVLDRLVQASGGRHGRELLAEVCLRQLALDCAATQYRQLLERFNTPTAAVMLARIERARGRPDAALSVLQRAHHDRPDADYLGLDLLRELADQGSRKPLRELAWRLAKGAADAPMRMAVVRLLIRAGQPALAADIAAAAANPTIVLQLLHAYALDRMGQREQAKRMLTRLRPAMSTVDAVLTLSDLLVDRDSPAQAAALLRQMVRQRPDDELLTAKLAQTLILAGSARQAARLLREKLARRPKSARLKLGLVAALDRLGRWREAVTLARQAALAEPENAAAHNAVGYILASRGKQLEQAERAVRRAMRLEPLAPYIVDSLAWVLRARGQILEARHLLEIAVRLDRRDAELVAHLARVRSEMGNIAVALKLYRQALSLCHDQGLQSRWKRQLERLESARVGTADR